MQPLLSSDGARRPRWRRVFFDAAGTLRSGWAVVVFAVVLTVTGRVMLKLALSVHLAYLDLDNDVPLNQPLIVAEALRRLMVALLASWVASRALRMRLRDVGFVDVRPHRQFAAGVVLGAGLLSLVVAIGVLTGHEVLRPHGLDAHTVYSGVLLAMIFLPAAAAEEVVTRGFALGQLRRAFGRFGTPAAVLVSGAVFGLKHAGNPHVT